MANNLDKKTIRQTKRMKLSPKNDSALVDHNDDHDSSPSPILELNQETSVETSRPKRKATNSHFFRYLQTRNPSRLEEEDLKRALEASLEECPDYWPEDTASCSSSDQSNTPSSSADSSSGGAGDTCGPCNGKSCKYNNRNRNRRSSTNVCCSRSSSQACPQTTVMQHNHHNSSNHLNHCNHHCQNSYNHPATNVCQTTHCGNYSLYQCCPYSSVQKRYKPVAKKNIYNEADFFHDGIMEYIEYELLKLGGGG